MHRLPADWPFPGHDSAHGGDVPGQEARLSTRTVHHVWHHQCARPGRRNGTAACTSTQQQPMTPRHVPHSQSAATGRSSAARPRPQSRCALLVRTVPSGPNMHTEKRHMSRGQCTRAMTGSKPRHPRPALTEHAAPTQTVQTRSTNRNQGMPPVPASARPYAAARWTPELCYPLTTHRISRARRVAQAPTSPKRVTIPQPVSKLPCHQRQQVCPQD
jgi:hypothetical protein